MNRLLLELLKSEMPCMLYNFLGPIFTREYSIFLMRSRDVLRQQNIRSPLAFPFFQHFLPVSGDVCVAYSTSWRNATIMTTVAAFVQVIFKVGLPACCDSPICWPACFHGPKAQFSTTDPIPLLKGNRDRG